MDVYQNTVLSVLTASIGNPIGSSETHIKQNEIDLILGKALSSSNRGKHWDC